MDTDYSALEGITVVFAEDVEFLRISVERLLSRKVKKVVTAKDGAEALEKVRELQPDMLITDIEMPEMTGTELVEAIRNDLKLAMPIIVLTAHDGETHQVPGADARLYKPVRKTDLFDTMVRLLKEGN